MSHCDVRLAEGIPMFRHLHIHSWTWHEDVHLAENLEEYLRAYRHDPHGFWDTHEKRKHSSYNLELKLWECYETVLTYAKIR